MLVRTDIRVIRRGNTMLTMKDEGSPTILKPVSYAGCR
jgi:hypothetical protein